MHSKTLLLMRHAKSDHAEPGLKDHRAWGLLLLITICHGPGKLSLDYLIGRLVRR